MLLMVYAEHRFPILERVIVEHVQIGGTQFIHKGIHNRLCRNAGEGCRGVLAARLFGEGIVVC